MHYLTVINCSFSIVEASYDLVCVFNGVGTLQELDAQYEYSILHCISFARSDGEVYDLIKYFNDSITDCSCSIVRECVRSLCLWVQLVL